MKTFLVASSFVISSIAFAGNQASEPVGFFGDLGYSYRSGIESNDGSSSNGYSIGLGYAPTKFLELDLKSAFSTDTVDSDEFFSFADDDYDFSTTRLEFGGTGYYGFDELAGVYGRGALGHNWLSSREDTGYGSIEGGFYVKPMGSLSPTKVKVGYRYQDSFDSDVDYRTDAFVLSGEYEVMPGHSMTGSYEYSTGDVEFNGFNVGYRVRF